MTVYNNKVILLIGGLNLIDTSFAQHLLEGGAKEVRILDGSETTLQELRDELLVNNSDATDRLRFFVGDLSDNTYLEEAMSGTDFVLFIPVIPRPFDCEVAPAVTTINFLETVSGVVHVAIDCKIKKFVVVSPNRQEPLEKMPDMLAALMETVVVAEGRYLGKDSEVSICCARLHGNFGELADYAFEKAVNGDLIVRKDKGILCTLCANFDFKREVL